MTADGPYRDGSATSREPGPPAVAPTPPAISFRTFVVFPSARRVICGDVEVELGGRAFDLLMVLLRARGFVVHKDELMRAVWPTTTVDESNLRFQMGTLRKALGQHRDVIKTIPGRGYLLAEDGRYLPFQQTDCSDVTLFTAERITELEHENSRLRIAIANLAFGTAFPQSSSGPISAN